MPQTVRAYILHDLNQMTEIWNEVVRAGNAFPQENPLTLKEAEAFFGVCALTHRFAGRTVLWKNLPVNGSFCASPAPAPGRFWKPNYIAAIIH